MLNAQLVAENIAAQLEKQYFFPPRYEALHRQSYASWRKGYKDSGFRPLWAALKSHEAEQYHEGTIPLQTLRADIDYGFAEANTTYGRNRR